MFNLFTIYKKNILKKYNNNIKRNFALLIIDIQDDFCLNLFNYDKKRIINVTNNLIDYFYRKGLPIISTQHLPEKYGSLDINIKSEFIKKNFNKSKNDAFKKSILNKYLNSLNLTDLVIIGMSSNYCVRETVNSALNFDYNVYISQDAIVAQKYRQKEHRESLKWFSKNSNFYKNHNDLIQVLNNF